MSNNKDYQALARRFVDLWQEQMAHMVNDSDFVRALLQMMQNTPHSANDNPSYAPPRTPTEPAGRPAPAPDAGLRALDSIRERLDAIEERLGQLERGPSSEKRFSGGARRRVSMVRPPAGPRTRRGGGKRGKKKGR